MNQNTNTRQPVTELERLPAVACSALLEQSGLRLKTDRWLRRQFRSQAAQNQWCEKHKHEVQIVPLFVDNEYWVEFRKMKQL